VAKYRVCWNIAVLQKLLLHVWRYETPWKCAEAVLSGDIISVFIVDADLSQRYRFIDLCNNNNTAYARQTRLYLTCDDLLNSLFLTEAQVLGLLPLLALLCHPPVNQMIHCWFSGLALALFRALRRQPTGLHGRATGHAGWPGRQQQQQQRRSRGQFADRQGGGFSGLSSKVLPLLTWRRRA